MKRIRFSFRSLLLLVCLCGIALVPISKHLRRDAAIERLRDRGAMAVYVRETDDGYQRPYIDTQFSYDTWNARLMGGFLGRSAVDRLDHIVFQGRDFSSRHLVEALPELRILSDTKRIELHETELTVDEAMAILANAGLTEFTVDD